MSETTSIDPAPGKLQIPGPGPCATAKPRLGFLGVGWIGRHRMQALAASELVELVAIGDSNPEILEQAVPIAPGATRVASLDELLDLNLDGVVIATPSALHADQAVRALQKGVAVFCQKPLGRNAAETRTVIETARRTDSLLGVDLSYRFMKGMAELNRLCTTGDLGSVYAADMVFHNAYGPDKPWFYDRALAGGGCVVDLGIHLVDLALWNLGFPAVTDVTSRLFSQGKPLQSTTDAVEDYCEARIDLQGGSMVRVACSWKLAAGQDAVISGTFYGTKGGASFSNVNGSFYDFVVERFHGTRREVLAQPPDVWGGRAAVHWARQLTRGEKFDNTISNVAQVAEVLDAIYDSAP